MKKFISKLPYWLKGMLIPPMIMLILLCISFLSFFIGFGLNIKPFAYLGFISTFILALPSIYIGGAIVETINYLFGMNIKISEGGGSPTIIASLAALLLFILIFAIIFHIYGKIKIKKTKPV